MNKRTRFFWVYFICFIQLVFVTSSFINISFTTSGDWPQFGYDAQNTGFTPEDAPEDPEKIWTFNTSGAVVSSPAIAHEMVFVGSNDKNLYALDLETGSLIWKFETGGAIESSAMVVDNVVYIGSFDGNLYAINVSSGAEIWRFSTGGDIHSPPLFWENKIYINSWNGVFYAINAFTGEEEWNLTTGNVQGSAVASGSMVIEGGCDEIIRFIDASTGELIWEFDSNGNTACSPTISRNRIYFGNNDNKMFCLDLELKKEIWNFTLGGFTISAPSVGYGKIYFGARDNKIYAYASPSLAEEKVFIGSDDGFFYMLNASDGNLLWSYPVGGEIRSQAAISEGYAVIGSTQNSVTAFYSSNPEQPNGDNQSSGDGGDLTLVYVLEVIVIVIIFGVIIIAIYQFRKGG
jgi:outer membrane protein assembly factor BamB